jgi:hypothetical protein
MLDVIAADNDPPDGDAKNLKLDRRVDDVLKVFSAANLIAKDGGLMNYGRSAAALLAPNNNEIRLQKTEKLNAWEDSISQ